MPKEGDKIIVEGTEFEFTGYGNWEPVRTQAQIIDLLKEINNKKHNSLLFISHDLDLVGDLCHRIAIMYAGHIIEVIEDNKKRLEDVFSYYFQLYY